MNLEPTKIFYKIVDWLQPRPNRTALEKIADAVAKDIDKQIYEEIMKKRC